jgi:hypothetical protein
VSWEVIEADYGNWLAGLIDGEGCFRVHKEKGGGYYACHFTLKLRDDDRAMLEEIVVMTGIGHVKADASRSGNSKPCAVWTVHSKDACARLVTLLDRFPLRSRKARDYEVWRRAVAVWLSMRRGHRWSGPRDWTPLIDLKLELEQAREYREGVVPDVVDG